MMAEIDAIIKAQIGAEDPGAAVAVIKNGELLHCKGYGLANMEWSLPIQPDTVFRLASISKQFTAAAILLLEQQGKLSIDAPIQTYLPDYPSHGREISVRHLLTHTSGIKTYDEVEDFFEKYVKMYLPSEELIALFKDLPHDFEPGTRFKYNNSGYYLLGRIIEVVSRQSYEAFVREQIFSPLNMTNAYYMHNETIIPRRAAGYVRTEQGYQNATYLDMSVPYAGGSLGSTLEDLVRWDAALRECRLLSRETTEHMYTPAQLSNGTATEYGFGWYIEEYHGRRVAYHSGDINGFTTYITRFLDDAITVILLSNLNGRDTESLLCQIIRSVFEFPPLKRDAASLESDALQRFLGTYALRKNIHFAIERDGDKLMLQPFNMEIFPVSEAVCCFTDDPEREVRFSDLQSAGFRGMTIRFPFTSLPTTRILEE